MSDTPTQLRAAGSALRDAAAAVSARRGMTTVLIGSLIVAVGWLGERDSAWGFPMLIAGTALIALGLLGPRLSGSLRLDWGDQGVRFELSSAIAPPGGSGSAAALGAGSAEPGEAAGAVERELPPPVVPPTEIEGEAETIEISAAAIHSALGAVPAASESAPGASGSTQESAGSPVGDPDSGT